MRDGQVKGITFQGTSDVNRLSVCAVCGQFTDGQATRYLLHFTVQAETSRGKALPTLLLKVHMRCLLSELPAIALTEEMAKLFQPK